jgi:tRNA/tmRNA/rRNA uracil-C5-methylase (TrmA/RlmC/RlmD family)
VRTGRVVDPLVTMAAPLATTGFRSTLRLGVAADGRLGFRARASHDIVAVEHCLVAHPLLDGLLAGARLMGEDGTGATASEVTLRAGVATGERAAMVTTEGEGGSVWFERPDGVAVGGRASVHEEVRGAELRVSMPSFFQSRRDGAEALVDQVAAAIGTRPASMVDAYGGVGLFAATVGSDGDVVVIDGSASACADARQNLRGAGVVVQAPVEKWVPRHVDVVVADPSRTGLGKVAASVLAATAAPTLVLVSCDAVSLARDATLLAGHGYRHASSVVVDLFPHTPHVEVVTRFERTT